MELRSRRLGPPKEEEKPQNRDGSDKEGERSIFSDSDYNANSDEDRELWDLNCIPEDGEQDDDWEGNESDSDVGNKVAKWRKVEVKKKSGGGYSRKRKGERAEVEDRGVEIGGFRLQLEAHEIESDLLQLKKGKEKVKEKKRKKKESKPVLLWEVWEEEQERWLKENSMDDVNIENPNEMVAEIADAPSDLVMPLLRYQKEWLAWALKQEESTTRGGILADEMGMGKTVQAIALVLAKRELRRTICESNEFTSSPCSSTTVPKIKCTLIICPLVAVLQWVSEIERFTSKGSNKVLVYHGAKRGKTLQHFSQYDFVITTYSIVEAEYRKNVMPPKQKCPWCGRLFYEHRMPTHLRYFCGPDAIRTDKQSKQQRKSNKVLQKFSKQKSPTAGGHPGGPEDDGEKGLCKNTVKQSSKGKNLAIGSSKGSAGIAQGSPNEKSILHAVKWERIILDEAHYIKDRRCNTTKAVLALGSSYKWALSGTPLQNRVGEIYSLVRFLQIVPYSYYFCKDCDCRVLDHSSSTDCPNCPHKSPRHFCWWNKYIATPIQVDGHIGAGKNAMILLKNKILKNIVLRRTKKGRAADLALPPRIVRLRRDTMDIGEEDYYTSLYTESQAQFNTYIEAGTVMNNYAHIFDLLTRLRQAVDHPYLVVYSSSAAARIGSVVDSSGSDEKICGLCNEQTEDLVVSSCLHAFCTSCLNDLSTSAGQVLCPSCSKPLSVDFNPNAGDQNAKTTIKGFKSSSILNRIPLDDFQTSTKIDALREEIRFMVERDGSAKGIVFSQFTSFLDLIHYSLQKSGISCVQLVGSMSMSARDAAITKFTNDPDCRIFLMSLKAGGVALNLTVASHIFLMDPWWNPAVERQAQDRIHRIGQYKPIRIVRFVIENTIEERILKLQEKKELVFEGTVGGSSEALGKLTEAEMRFLFIT